MKKMIICSTLLLSFLVAGEISFIPTSNNNISYSKNMFSKKYIKLPSKAKSLSYVKLGYKTSNGNIEEKKIIIDNDIDHRKLLVVTTKDMLDNSKASFKKPNPLTIPIFDNISDQTISKSKEFKLSKDFTFKTDNNMLTIFTKDTLIKHFDIKNPNKIVLDFNSKNSFPTKNININQGSFKSVKIGSHKNFYRASFLLNTTHKYTLQQSVNTITIKLK